MIRRASSAVISNTDQEGRKKKVKSGREREKKEKKIAVILGVFYSLKKNQYLTSVFSTIAKKKEIKKGIKTTVKKNESTAINKNCGNCFVL